MKKLALVMVLILSITAFAACNNKSANKPSRDNPLVADDVLAEKITNFSAVIEYSPLNDVKKTLTYKVMPNKLYYYGLRGGSEENVTMIVDYTEQTYIVTAVDSLTAVKMAVNETVQTVDYEPTKFLSVDVTGYTAGDAVQIAGRAATTYTNNGATAIIDDETGACLSYDKGEESWVVTELQIGSVTEADFVLSEEYEVNDLSKI